jgi:hypothetical protein
LVGQGGEDLFARFRDSWTPFATVLSLADLFGSPLVATPWGLLHLASSAFAHQVTAINPIDGMPLSLALGVTLVTPSGNWQKPLADWIKEISRRASIQVETGTPASYEEAGAIDAFRRVVDLTRSETYGPRKRIETEKAEIEINSLAALAAFDSSNVKTIDGHRLVPRFPWIIDSLDRLLHPMKPGMYHVVKDGLDQQTIRRLQHRAAIHVPPIAVSLFTTSSIDEMMRIFEKRETTPLLARLSVIYDYGKIESEKKPLRVKLGDKIDIDQFVLDRLNKRCAGTIRFSPDGLRVLRRLYDYGGPGHLSKNMQSYKAERSRHLIRLAILVALLRDAEESVVTDNDVLVGELLLASSEESLAAIYLAVGMGLLGRVLALLVEAYEYFHWQNEPLKLSVAVAWLATSGIPIEQARKAIDSLQDAKLIKTQDNGELCPEIQESKLRIVTVMKRIGLIKSIGGLK